jgi:nucleoside-diphosphate-sugar epimerase
MPERERHVVFGAGQIGPLVAQRLAARGHDVRLVRRREAPAPGGVAVLRGDAGDPAFATEAARGATVVYHCMNPAYSAAVWERELPRIMTSLVAAAGRAGARLVVLDNLYMLGRPAGPMNEDTPVSPASRKGLTRARVAEMMLAAHHRGDVRAVSGRASDFYGPAGTKSFFGDYFWPRVLAGKSAQLLVHPDVPHTWHYTHDVAAGLVALGEADEDVCGRWWMLPCTPPVTPRDMVRLLATAMGRDIPITRMSPALLGLLGWVVPILREVREMHYQWDTPFVCDDRRFRARFEVLPTASETGAAETVAWARLHYAAARAV